MLVKLAGDLSIGGCGLFDHWSEVLQGLEITAGHVSHVLFSFMGVGGVTHQPPRHKILVLFLQTRHGFRCRSNAPTANT